MSNTEDTSKKPDLSKITFLDKDNWVENLEQDKVTLVFFMSGNHLDCRAQIPRIISFAEKNGDDYNICVADVLKVPEAASVCGIDGVPTMLIMRQGVSLGGRRGGLPDSETDITDFLMRLDHFQKMNMDVFMQSEVKETIS